MTAYCGLRGKKSIQLGGKSSLNESRDCMEDIAKEWEILSVRSFRLVRTVATTH
jgi:hypothetical protein